MTRKLVVALLAVLATVLPQAALAAPPDGQARIHYHRPKGDYEGWGLHAWEDTPLNVAWPRDRKSVV